MDRASAFPARHHPVSLAASGPPRNVGRSDHLQLPGSTDPAAPLHMSTQLSHESAFVDHVDIIQRAALSIAVRHGVRGADADDFASLVKLKMIEDDYAVFRKFRGESSLATYLTVVIAMLFRDYQFQRWGRWRPSAFARRKGELAIRLETLVRRDGLSLDAAAESLRTAGHTQLSTRELGRILSDLPSRAPLRPVDVGVDTLLSAPAAEGSDDVIIQSELAETRALAERALDDAITALPVEDAVMLRLRFHQGLTVADIARVLRLDQKPLYRRIERALAFVRQRLEAAGISIEVARELLDDAADHRESV